MLHHIRSFLKTGILVGMALGLLACGGPSYQGKIIAVQSETGSVSGETKLVLIDASKNGKAKVLFEQLHSAASPSLSHDARYLYFQAKETARDPWQIWVADLKKNSLEKLTDFPENCTSPAALPDEKVVFSRESHVRGEVTADLWKIGLDGCCLTRLTYDPGVNTAPSVLREGRILYHHRALVPDPGPAKLRIMRPDGTKSEVYTHGWHKLFPGSKGSESPDGHVYFLSDDGSLSRVQHRRPLHTFERTGRMLEGELNSLFACRDSSLLLSYRQPGEELLSIYRFLPGSGLPPELLSTGKSDLRDPIAVEAVAPRPRILPSAVDPEKTTAQLMIQDINHSMLPMREGLRGDSLATQIRISTLDGELARVECKDDGSVYLKMDAQVPFRIETLNAQGESLRDPTPWIYLHPNERKAFTGFQSDPELAPRNYQPHAVKEDPVDLSTHKGR